MASQCGGHGAQAAECRRLGQRTDGRLGLLLAEYWRNQASRRHRAWQQRIGCGDAMVLI